MAISSGQDPPPETEVAKDETAADTRTGAAAADPKRWMALLVLLVAAFMDMLDGTIANVASPAVQQGICGGYSVIQWMLVGYQLSFALLLILGGRLGDIHGRKKMFLLGVAGFTLASLGAGLAQEPWQLVASRMDQGAFAGIMVPQILAIIHVAFSAKERAGAFAMYGGVAGLAAAVGMGAGGPLAEWDLFGLGWRLIFLIDIPVGVLGVIYAARDPRVQGAARPEARRPQRRPGHHGTAAADLPATAGPRTGLAAVGLRVDGGIGAGARRVRPLAEAQDEPRRFAADGAGSVPHPQLHLRSRCQPRLLHRHRHVQHRLDRLHAGRSRLATEAAPAL